MGDLWKIQLFGGLRAIRSAPLAAISSSAPDGSSTSQVVERFRTQKTAVLLAYLAYYPQSHSREVLGELLWPDKELQTCSQNLRTALASLRRQLEPPGVPPGAVIVSSRTAVQLNRNNIRTDAYEFKLACSQARAAARGSEEKIALLEVAVSLYTGAFLPGFYDEWITTEARQLEDEYFSLLLELLKYLNAAGDHGRCLYFARQGLTHDKERAELVEMLVPLCRELSISYTSVVGPSPDEGSRRGRSKSPRARHAGDEIATSQSTPLHERELDSRDTTPADEAATNSTGSFSPQVTDEREQMNSAPVALPAVLDRFFGREAEITRVCNELEQSATRLLTITGAGGGGKTRLAIEAAHQFINARWQRDHAVYYVPLADLRAGHLIVSAILETLQLPRAGKLLSGVSPEAAPLDRLCVALNARPTLLVLDNFEHLTASGAPLVQVLLGRVPTLQVLVTSQHGLGISGGRELTVSGLPVPPVEDQTSLERLMEFPSVQLFVDRAQAVAPDFQLTRHNAPSVADICRCLDGAPLALELAAARSGAFSPAQMAARLASVQEKAAMLTATKRPATPRHLSLHTAITWSYELLPPDLARFWTKLSIFRSGFTVEAAEEVCEEPHAPHQLSHLRACSLLAVSERDGNLRFRVPELLREYGAEQLGTEERKLLAARHAHYVNGVLQDSMGAFRTNREGEAVSHAVAESGNASAALDWALGRPTGSSTVRTAAADPALGASLSLSLGMCLQRRGLHREALDIVHAGLAATEAPGEAPPELRIALLREHAGLSLDLLDWPAAQASAEQMLQLCRKTKDSCGVAIATNLLGLAAKGDLQWKAARKYFLSARKQFLQLGDEVGLANISNNLGLIEYLDEDGDKATAAEHLQESLRLRQKIGDARSIAETHVNLGALAQQSGNWNEAQQHYASALAVETQLQHIFGVGRALCNLGEVAEEQEQTERALRLYIVAGVLFDEAGVAYQQYTRERESSLEAEEATCPKSTRDQARQLVSAGRLAELVAWATEEQATLPDEASP